MIHTEANNLQSGNNRLAGHVEKVTESLIVLYVEAGF